MNHTLNGLDGFHQVWLPKVLSVCDNSIHHKTVPIKGRGFHRINYYEMLEAGEVAYLYPDKQKSSNQKVRLITRGKSSVSKK